MVIVINPRIYINIYLKNESPYIAVQTIITIIVYKYSSNDSPKIYYISPKSIFQMYILFLKYLSSY